MSSSVCEVSLRKESSTLGPGTMPAFRASRENFLFRGADD